MQDIKREMKTRARLAKGLTNALSCDVEYINSDVDNYDIICMNESIAEAKNTLQKLLDNITELEYLLYLIKKKGS